jgi:uncharacterized protein
MTWVSALAIAPVKGMRLVAVDEVLLEEAGARGDRAFHLRESDGSITSTARNAGLVEVVPSFDVRDGTLTLAMPDGSSVAGPIALGAGVETAFYDGRRVPGREVDGPFSAALTRLLGRPVTLVAHEAGVRGGDDHAVTLMSRASLHALGHALGAPAVDPRRFRMTIEIDGAAPWDEHTWGGREVRAGDARLRVAAPTERCAVTTRDPDDGHRDLPVLHALGDIRGRGDVTFGVWCDVLTPGAVRIGDAVEVV